MGPHFFTVYLRIGFYIWAMFETGLLSNLYFYAWKESNDSRIMFWAATLYASVSLYFLFQILLAYTSLFDMEFYAAFISFLFVPSGLIAFVAHRLRNKSLSNPKGVRKVRKYVPGTRT